MTGEQNFWVCLNIALLVAIWITSVEQQTELDFYRTPQNSETFFVASLYVSHRYIHPSAQPRFGAHQTHSSVQGSWAAACCTNTSTLRPLGRDLKMFGIMDFKTWICLVYLVPLTVSKLSCNPDKLPEQRWVISTLNGIATRICLYSWCFFLLCTTVNHL